jgi:hypothetical protein
VNTHIHMCIDREGLIRNLRSGATKARDVAPGWTKKGLIAALESMTCRVLPVGDPCEGFDPERGCPGHREDDEPNIIRGEN